MIYLLYVLITLYKGEGLFMHKRKNYSKLIYYFNRLNQENKDYIISLMIQLFRDQFKNNCQRSKTKNLENIIYFYKE